MTAPAVALTESRTEYAVRSYGRVVVRKLYVSAWTDCPDGGEPS